MNTRGLVQQTHITSIHIRSIDKRRFQSSPSIKQPLCHRHNQSHHHRLDIICASSRRGMSSQQRWRAFKFNVKDKINHLKTVPPLSTVIAAMAAFHRAMQPVYNAIEALNASWITVQSEYNQFIAEETKRKWTWSNRNKKELELLESIPIYIFCRFFMTFCIIHLIFAKFTHYKYMCNVQMYYVR